MFMTLDGGMEGCPRTSMLWAMGYKFIVDPMTPVLALHKAMGSATGPWPRTCRTHCSASHKAEHEALNLTIDLEKLLAIERATVER